MHARSSFAVLALAVCLVGSQADAQGETSGGQLKLPENVLKEGSASADSGSVPVQSGVTGYELPTTMSDGPTYDSGAGGSYSGGGSVYSPSLGGHLRARYNTQSYGQPAGNLDLGTMFMQSDGYRSIFFDGQVTMNDESHIGFNVGVGARTISETELGFDAISGLSVWADGTSTQNENFFPQVGVSYELLTDLWDLRGNASFVVEDQTALGPAKPLGTLGYNGFNIVQASITGRDNAMHLTELELARRLFDRELWGFGGAYGLYGADSVETAGYKFGLRGYATPDVALQIAVTDDDLFKTNTIFSITWFIGRTRTNTPFHCNLQDRLREPVQRNDYVAVYQDSVTGGGALTFDLDGDGTTQDIRVVHFDAGAAAGGDGSFENPFNDLDDANAASQEFDVLLVHSGGTFTNDNLVMMDGQRLLFEGTFESNVLNHTVNTDQFGTLSLPETSSGSQALATSVVNNAAGAAVTLADQNEVAGGTFTGGANAIVAGGSGAGDPNLHDLSISGTTGDGIVLTPFERVVGN
ncbi:MAG: hypothetical protein KDA37_17055, partial [Planctomycetales bacterium]|nr:hypothetical protein [Planctomycetales bacterium]